MNIAAAWRTLWSTKESAVGHIIAAAVGTRGPIWTPRNYETFSKEGYQKNIIAFRSIKLLATSAASVPWGLFQNDIELDTHPLVDLMNHPNPLMAQSEFFENVFSYYLITGNSYIEGVTPNVATQPPTELWPQRPDRMRVKAGRSNIPSQYIYSVGGEQPFVWDVDEITGKSAILHLQTFNPTDDWYGLSPLEAAAMSVDIHNDTLGWNKAMVQNDARPPGVLTYAPKEGPDLLSDDQRERILEELEQRYSGKESTKRPLLLEGGLEWQQLGLSPKDMDFVQAKHTTSTDIAQAYGVPPQMLGIPGSQTFANYAEARLAMWEDVVIPLLYSIRDEFNNWLTPMYGENIRLQCKLDDVPALTERRKQHFEMVMSNDVLTVNEKREELGLEPVEGGDVVLVPSTMMPLDFAGDIDIPAEGDEAAKAYGLWNEKHSSSLASDPDNGKHKSNSVLPLRSKGG